MEQSELTSKFHLIAGTYISAKIFSEYAYLLRDCYSHKIRGDTTKINRTIEAESKINKLITLLGNELQSIGCDLGVTESEIEAIEETLYSILTLNPKDQSIVFEVINGMKATYTHE